MIKVRVRQALFEPEWDPYRNVHSLVPNKNGKYRFIISAMSANWHPLEDAGTQPDIDKFSETFAELPISSLIDHHSRCNQSVLHKDGQDNMAFQTTQGMYRPTRLVQRATNSV